jgi:tRNA (guanine-N7-)-methyltransferase
MIKTQTLLSFSSGCGTGKSTVTLGKLYPNHTIIGVDRSLARLTKNGVYRDQAADGETTGNVFFVRAELADFWRLWLQSSLTLPEKHFLLYPNPYPKKRRFQNRWYAHPAFPLILQMKSQEVIIRSNWKAYLEDFVAAVALAEKHQPRDGDGDGDGDAAIAYHYTATGPTEIDSAQSAWTNFEQKYFDVGETCYELFLDKK